jgi:hypothetical protein
VSWNTEHFSLEVFPEIVLIVLESGAVPAAKTSAPAAVRRPGAWSNLYWRFDMGTLPDRSGGFPLDAQSEVNELRDIGAADCTPTLGSAVTWTDVDRMWAAAMERRDRQAARPEGYRDAACEACGLALYVPIRQRGDVLCPQCQREGQALAAVTDGDDGDGPRPPAGGALHPDYPYFAALAARMLDDQLCEAIGIAEGEPATFRLLNVGQRDAFVDAMSAEVVRRLEGQRAA